MNDTINLLQHALAAAQAQQASVARRPMAIAITHIETALLWAEKDHQDAMKVFENQTQEGRKP